MDDSSKDLKTAELRKQASISPVRTKQ